MVAREARGARRGPAMSNFVMRGTVYPVRMESLTARARETLECAPAGGQFEVFDLTPLSTKVWYGD
jgi:hypothetical protein